MTAPQRRPEVTEPVGGLAFVGMSLDGAVSSGSSLSAEDRARFGLDAQDVKVASPRPFRGVPATGNLPGRDVGGLGGDPRAGSRHDSYKYQDGASTSASSPSVSVSQFLGGSQTHQDEFLRMKMYGAPPAPVDGFRSSLTPEDRARFGLDGSARHGDTLKGADPRNPYTVAAPNFADTLKALEKLGLAGNVGAIAETERKLQALKSTHRVVR